jgi:tetratricopeptide (TPR) repeat protein
MAKLFLSYSRKDAARAERFTRWIEHEGHDVWRDEEDIGGGATFSSEIEKALTQCNAVLVLWSEHSVLSAWVRDEAGFGRDSGKLIPLSLDKTEPPLGFRQFQSIDLSNWRGRGQPGAADRIRRAIATVAGGPSASPPRPLVGTATRAKFVRSFARPPLLAAMFVLAAGAGVAIFQWRQSGPTRAITIAVQPSPTSPDQQAAADYATVAAADMASFLPTHSDRAKVIAPVATAGGSGYRMLISVNRPGSGRGASLTLSDADGQTILWSKSWSEADQSAGDLRQDVSRSASQAALCLTDAKSSNPPLIQPALGLYESGCVAVDNSESSDAELLATFEKVAKLAPNFSPGWDYLAVSRSIVAVGQGGTAGASQSIALQGAELAIETARKLNPRSGLPYLAQSILQSDDHLRRLALLDKAAAVEPDNALVQMYRADALMNVGRMVESVVTAKRAVELNPLSAYTQSKYILALSYAGEFSRAKAAIADARKKWPNDPGIDSAEFAFQFRYGDPRAAEQLMPKVLDYSDANMIPYRNVIAARLAVTPRNVDTAIDSLRIDSSSHDRNRELLALGLFGRVDEAYSLLADPQFQRVVDPNILFRPEFGRVRADSRFMRVAAQLGLVRYWRESGNWPDFCTNERLPYDCKAEAAKYRQSGSSLHIGRSDASISKLPQVAVSPLGQVSRAPISKLPPAAREIGAGNGNRTRAFSLGS